MRPSLLGLLFGHASFFRHPHVDDISSLNVTRLPRAKTPQVLTTVTVTMTTLVEDGSNVCWASGLVGMSDGVIDNSKKHRKSQGRVDLAVILWWWGPSLALRTDVRSHGVSLCGAAALCRAV